MKTGRSFLRCITWKWTEEPVNRTLNQADERDERYFQSKREEQSLCSFFFPFFLNASCNSYCNNNLPPEGGHVTGVCWSAFHSCKQCVLDKIQQTQPVVMDQIWLHITSHVMLYRYVRLFYWNSNRVRCSFITVLYFNNSSIPPFQTKMITIIVYYIFVNTVHFKDRLTESAMIPHLWPGSWIPKDKDHPVLSRRLDNWHLKTGLPSCLNHCAWPRALPEPVPPAVSFYPAFKKNPRDGLCFNVLNDGVQNSGNTDPHSFSIL